MAFLPIEEVWTEQPPVGTPIDWAHPIFSRGGFVVHTASLPPGGTATAVTFSPHPPNGMAADMNGTTSNISMPSNNAYNILGELTLIWVGTVTDFANYNMLVTRAVTNGAINNPFELRTDQTTGVLRLTRANGTLYGQYVSSALPTGRSIAVVISHGGDLSTVSRGSVFWDGIKQYYAVSSTGPAAPATGNTEPMYIGKRADGLFHKGSTSLLVGVPKLPTDSEGASLSKNPWQIFQP